MEDLIYIKKQKGLNKKGRQNKLKVIESTNTRHDFQGHRSVASVSHSQDCAFPTKESEKPRLERWLSKAFQIKRKTNEQKKQEEISTSKDLLQTCGGDKCWAKPRISPCPHQKAHYSTGPKKIL